MRFTFAGMDEAQDQAAQTDLLVKQVQNGSSVVDEAREELQRTPWGLPETSGPLVFTQMGLVPLDQVPVADGSRWGTGRGQTHGGERRGCGDGRGKHPVARRAPPAVSRPVGTHNPRLGLPAGGRHADGGAVIGAGGAARVATPRRTRRPARTRTPGRLPRRRSARSWTPWPGICGRAATSPRGRADHIPGAVLAMVAEDLTKGLTVDEAVDVAATVVLPKAAYEWADKASAGQGQNQQGASQQQAAQQAQQLAQTYAQRIRAAFTAVAKAALRLIRMWLTGALAVTALALAGMIAELIRKHLTPVLSSLWREAWHLGSATAVAVIRDEEPDWEPSRTGTAATSAAMDAWLASHGRDTIEGITTTRISDLAAMLSQGSAAGESAEHMAAAISVVLGFDQRTDTIAVTETERGKNGGMTDAYRLAGVMQKSWQTMRDGKVCADLPR